MKKFLLAATASLALTAGTAFASSESYPDPVTETVSTGTASVDTGSEGYFAGKNDHATQSNAVLQDTGSAATPVFSGVGSQIGGNSKILGSVE